MTEGPVRERKFAKLMRIAEPARQLEEVEALRAELAASGEFVILFGDTIKGDAVRRLVAFGDSLGIPVKYVCLVDYSNSRGASDMGLLPDLGPGYHPAGAAGLNLPEMLAAPDLDRPLGCRRESACDAAVRIGRRIRCRPGDVHDGNGEAGRRHLPRRIRLRERWHRHQRHRRSPATEAGSKTMGAKPDLEIFGLIAKDMGIRDFLACQAGRRVRTNPQERARI